MRREIDDCLFARDIRNGLLDLWRMPMVSNIVRAEIIVKLREMVALLRRSPRTAYTRLRIDDNRVDINQMLTSQWRKREDTRRRETPSIADNLRIADTVAIKLCKPVDT